jgi:transcriptional regulator with XRE-family HTH domain
MEFKERLKAARTAKGYSQGQLAELIGVHVTNISRYERGENRPTSDVLTKLGEALGVSGDYLMSGTVDEAAGTVISDRELLAQFHRVEALPSESKRVVKELLDAFLFKTEVQQKLAQAH